MKFLHFGFKVHNIERTAAAYGELLGLDWEPVREFELMTRVGATQGLARSKVTHAVTADGVEIELVQSLSGPSVDDELLGDREGLSHIAFVVEDLAMERARAEAKGIEVLSEGEAPRARWIFLKDDRFGGALVQLVELSGDQAAS